MFITRTTTKGFFPFGVTVTDFFYENTNHHNRQIRLDTDLFIMMLGVYIPVAMANDGGRVMCNCIAKDINITGH